jgi:hypothetical protein
MIPTLEFPPVSDTVPARRPWPPQRDPARNLLNSARRVTLDRYAMRRTLRRLRHPPWGAL